jgi:hypothetical protein
MDLPGLSVSWLAFVCRDQNAAVQEGPYEATTYYLSPRRSAISCSSSLRLSSLTPDATYASRNFWSSLPSLETDWPRAWPSRVARPLLVGFPMPL